MKLWFLYRICSTSNDSFPTVSLDNTAHFLEESYIIRRPMSSMQPTSQSSIKTYRGIVYYS